MNKSIAYILASLVLLTALCFLGYGFLNVIGSSASEQASLPLGLFLMAAGLAMVIGGIAILWKTFKQTPSESQPQVLKLDLPGQTKLESISCLKCGGTLSADNIKMVNGAPIVTCPYCGAIYELTEEPKW